MNEQKLIKKYMIKNMLINFILFTAVLLIFDFIIYNQVSTSLFKNVDEQLKDSSNRITESVEPDNKPPEEEIGGEDEDRLDLEEQEFSPRVINITRNESGEIQNQNMLGTLAEYEDSIKFDVNDLDNIYNLKLDNKYYYRGINLQIENEGQTQYVQVLINIDGEMDTIENILNILVLGTTLLIIISIIISYILSKRNIKPLIEAYKKQTEFVQNASHELRTPLAIIQAKQELLLKEPNSKIIDKSKDINLALTETKRLTRLIKELMDLARADEGRYKLEKELVNINDLIKEVSVPYEEMANIQNKKLILDLSYKKDLNCDKNKMFELMVIILDNAIKYTLENDEIKIKTYKKDKKCVIEISDTGIGVSDEDLNHIFDRFYRADKARTKETGGTGLGLSIAKTIVNMHGGIIYAEHNTPKGIKIIVKI